jgi:uncharacterized protein (TIGR03066 family)
MNRLFFKALLFLVILALNFGCASTQTKDDSLNRKLLLGAWEKTVVSNDQTKKVIILFRDDGTFSTQGKVIAKNGAHRDINVEGTWIIDNHYLIEVVTKSNFAKPGITSKDKILQLSEEEYVYQDESGKQQTYKKASSSQEK